MGEGREEVGEGFVEGFGLARKAFMQNDSVLAPHHTEAYGNNRADGSFIPGGVIPGYIVIRPDFPECIDDFGFLWFENEYIVGVASRWILAANAADALVR